MKYKKIIISFIVFMGIFFFSAFSPAFAAVNVWDEGNGPAAYFADRLVRCPVIRYQEQDAGVVTSVRNIAYCVDPAMNTPNDVAGGHHTWVYAPHRGQQSPKVRNAIYWGYGGPYGVGYVETWGAVMHGLGLGYDGIQWWQNQRTQDLWNGAANNDPPDWNFNWDIKNKGTKRIATYNKDTNRQETDWYEPVISGGNNPSYHEFSVSLPDGVGAYIRDDKGNVYDYGKGPGQIKIQDKFSIKLYADKEFVSDVNINLSFNATICTTSRPDCQTGCAIYEPYGSNRHQALVVALIKNVNKNFSANISASFTGGYSDIEITKSYGDPSVSEGPAVVYTNTPTNTSNVTRRFLEGYKSNIFTVDYVEVSQVKDGKYTVTAKNLRGINGASITSVQFPTWSAAYSGNTNQDDIIWYQASRNGNDFSITVKLSDHKNDQGAIITHMYVNSNNQTSAASGVVAYNTAWLDSIEYSELKDDKFTVTIRGLINGQGVNGVSVPTWSEKEDASGNAQDDIYWYEAKRRPDGSYQYEVDIKNHKNDTGNYITHVYTIDPYSRLSLAAKSSKYKIDKQYLQGATFELQKPDGTLVQSGTTDENGKLTFSKVLSGENYVIKEVAAPEGFKLAEPITFKPVKRLEYVNIKDEIVPTGDLTITKTGGMKGAVEGGGSQYLNPEENMNIKKTFHQTSQCKDRFGELTYDALEVSEVRNNEFTVKIKNPKYTSSDYEFMEPSFYIKVYSKETGQSKSKQYLAEKSILGNDYTATIKLEDFASNKGTYCIGIYYEGFLVTGDRSVLWFYQFDDLAIANNVPNFYNVDYSELKNNEISVTIMGFVNNQGINSSSIPLKLVHKETGKESVCEASKIGVDSYYHTFNLNEFDNANGTYSLYIEAGSVSQEAGEFTVNRNFLPDVEFALYDKSGSEIARGKTNTNGQLTFSNVARGEYTLKELNNPDNRYEPISPMKVNISDATQKITVRNEYSNTPPTVIAEDIVMSMDDNLTTELLLRDAVGDDAEDGPEITTENIQIDNWAELLDEFNQKKEEDADSYETIIKYSVVDSGGLKATTTATLTVINTSRKDEGKQAPDGYVRFISKDKMATLRSNSKWHSSQRPELSNLLQSTLSKDPSTVPPIDMKTYAAMANH